MGRVHGIGVGQLWSLPLNQGLRLVECCGQTLAEAGVVVELEQVSGKLSLQTKEH